MAEETIRRGSGAARHWDYAYDRHRRSVAARPARASREWALPRLRLLPILVFLLVGLALSLGVLLFNSPLFKVQSIDVQGASNLNTATIVELSEAHGDNIFTLDPGLIERRLERHPYIKVATVKRDWPNGIKITVVERVPTGLWQVGNQSFLVDAEGMVMALLDGAAPVGTIPIAALVPQSPAIGSFVDADAISLVERLRADVPAWTGEQIASFEYSPSYGLKAVTTAGLVITFGDRLDYDFKLASLAGVISEARNQGVVFNSIDLRFGESPALR
jgi:cell division septal protein FtsQ